MSVLGGMIEHRHLHRVPGVPGLPTVAGTAQGGDPDLALGVLVQSLDERARVLVPVEDHLGQMSGQLAHLLGDGLPGPALPPGYRLPGGDLAAPVPLDGGVHPDGHLEPLPLLPGPRPLPLGDGEEVVGVYVLMRVSGR